MVNTHGEHPRRGAAAFAAALCTVALGACTPSVAPGTEVGSDPFATPVVPSADSSQSGDDSSAQSGALDAPTPRRGHSTVRVAHPAGRELPSALVDAFTRATGFTVTQVSVPVDEWEAGTLGDASADVLVDLDGTDLLAATRASTLADSAPQDTTTPEGTAVEGASAGIAYARDDVCVLADAQWFAANRIDDLPTTLTDLTSSDVASLLSIPDPTTTIAGRSFVQLIGATRGDDAASTMASLLGAGARIVEADRVGASWTASAQDDAQSGSTTDTEARPLVVAPMSQIAASETNTGTEAAGRAVAGTCVGRDLYAAIGADAGNEDGAESLVAYLLGRGAQRILADTATAYPLDTGAVEGTPAQWFLTPSQDAVALSDEQVGETSQWMASWAEATPAG